MAYVSTEALLTKCPLDHLDAAVQKNLSLELCSVPHAAGTKESNGAVSITLVEFWWTACRATLFIEILLLGISVEDSADLAVTDFAVVSEVLDNL